MCRGIYDGYWTGAQSVDEERHSIGKTHKRGAHMHDDDYIPEIDDDDWEAKDRYARPQHLLMDNHYTPPTDTSAELNTVAIITGQLMAKGRIRFNDDVCEQSVV